MLESFSPILPSRDLDAAEAFWARLGFATVYKDAAEYLLMRRDGAEVHFWLKVDLDPARNDYGGYLRPSDVDALDAEWNALGLPSAGIPRLVRAEDKPWGMRELALVDADGNLIRAGHELPFD
ncbi:MAG: VOC family protein [Rhodobacteraceae bacterium]|nr:VOC family protein [Paracoccaceae bacterium]